VVGDVHGQLFDLPTIFEANGLPGPTNPYLFNGDFVDRGSFSLETLLVLLAWKVTHPAYVRLARGNHESHDMNVPYGFTGEVLTKYGEEAYMALQQLFAYLPLAHVVNGDVFVVHGGLPRGNVGLAEIEALDRVAVTQMQASSASQQLFSDLLWADPRPEQGHGRSQRGGDIVTFGPDVTQRFLESNSLRLVIRSHEVKDEGFEWAHDGRCLTVFSAPNYCDACDNEGAVIRLTVPEGGGHLQAEVRCFSAVPRPHFYVPAMAYSPMTPQSRGFLSRNAKEVLAGFMGQRRR